MKKFLLIIIFLFICLIGFSEPSEGINWLLNEPVSMMDLGCYKLEREIKEAIKTSDTLKNIKISFVNFNYSRGKIEIVLICEIKSKQDVEDIIKSLLSGGPISSTLFYHYQYSKTKEPNNLDEEIYKNTEIIFYENKDPNSIIFSNPYARFPLSGTEIYFKE